ncbi:cytochrome c [Andreprevotia sp. IGB-42]|uniref:c-type cytochrome n=1 Tax=Andreprevotia sp. IGB-42 TaxID=2497473 RepID=UPI0035B56CEE
MAEVVENSLRHLEEADLRAMLRYLREIPPVHDSRDSKPRIAWGNPAGDEARLRGSSGISLGNTAGSAAELFSANCASCHGASGQGSEDGYYPALLHNSTTGARDPSNLIQVLLHGVTRDDGKDVRFMPGFGDTLDDAELAQLTNYVRSQFGNAPAAVTGKDIGQRRAGNAGKPWLLQAVLVGAILLLVIVLALLLRPRRSKPVRIDIDV